MKNRFLLSIIILSASGFTQIKSEPHPASPYIFCVGSMSVMYGLWNIYNAEDAGKTARRKHYGDNITGRNLNDAQDANEVEKADNKAGLARIHRCIIANFFIGCGAGLIGMAAYLK